MNHQTTVIADLPDREAVKLWIEERQLGRRNLTDDQRAVIADSVRERRSDAAKKERAANAGKAGGNGRLKESSLSVNVSDKLPKKDNRESVAKEARVPERKVRAVAEVKKKASSRRTVKMQCVGSLSVPLQKFIAAATASHACWSETFRYWPVLFKLLCPMN